MNSLVQTLRMARFCGVEGGSAGELRCRVWWNGRISRFTKTKSEAEDVFREIQRRGWA